MYSLMGQGYFPTEMQIRHDQDGERVLVVADLHLGWEVSLSHQGIHVPSQVPRLLEKLRKIISDTHPRRLILLGDVKHAVAKVELEEWKYVLNSLRVSSK